VQQQQQQYSQSNTKPPQEMLNCNVHAQTCTTMLGMRAGTIGCVKLIDHCKAARAHGGTCQLASNCCCSRPLQQLCPESVQLSASNPCCWHCCRSACARLATTAAGCSVLHLLDTLFATYHCCNNITDCCWVHDHLWV
jgi:hypothetical protein